MGYVSLDDDDDDGIGLVHYSDFGRLSVSTRREDIGLGSRLNFDDLSEDQRFAHDSIVAWARDPNSAQVLTMGGYAGTGKTTVVSVVAAELDNVVFCAYTGKAANVLRQKLAATGTRAECSTIHRLIYDPEIDEETGTVKGWHQKPGLEHSLIVVDEASMVDDAIFQDLCQYGVKILAVGDHGQLPPVKSNKISLMDAPDIRLERIHRQAADNPIIRLSVEIRERGAAAVYDVPKCAVDSITNHFLKDAEGLLSKAIICYTNRTRCQVNGMMRAGRGPDPEVGEILVCLKNTKFGHEHIFNGMRAMVAKVARRDGAHKYHSMGLSFPDDGLAAVVDVSKDQFGREATFKGWSEVNEAFRSWSQIGMLFDYGYCLTAHKMQGDSAKDVAVILERPRFVDDANFKRWLYTAVTRAVQNVYFVV